MSDIYVSIFMLTYNQEEFIGQAIEGVLMQETNFPYQLVIGEDASNDRTRTICQKYAAENPEKIKLLPSYKNFGLINNFIRTYKECKGKYVAICDGDDYWTDPLKLQKQVAFLDRNLDYSIVFTSFKFLFTNGRFEIKDYEDQRETTRFEDLIFKNYICSATVLFRNRVDPDDFPAWLDLCPYGDWPLYLWTARQGQKIKYLDDVTAVYRREIGVSEKMKSVPSNIAKENLKIVQKIKEDSNFPLNKKQIKKSFHQHQFALLAELYREKKILESMRFGSKLFFLSPYKTVRMYCYLTKKELNFWTT